MKYEFKVTIEDFQKSTIKKTAVEAPLYLATL
jgi:hypothetical protein